MFTGLCNMGIRWGCLTAVPQGIGIAVTDAVTALSGKNVPFHKHRNILKESKLCTEWSKSDATHSCRMFCFLKNKWHWNHKTQNSVTLSVWNAHRVHRCVSSLHSCRMEFGEEFCVTETVRQTWSCRFLWHRRLGKCALKIILASYIRESCQVVFDNEHSLHLRRHLCTSSVDSQLTDW
jgi:hypothetical protein